MKKFECPKMISQQWLQDSLNESETKKDNSLVNNVESKA